MRKKYDFCLSAMCVLLCFLILMSGIRKRDAALAADLAPNILRFHVLANSDSPEDQALKLEVKDFLLEEIRNLTASGTHPASVPLTKQDLTACIQSNARSLEEETEAFIREHGFNYPVKIRLETCEFPLRTYGDMTFPAGTYEAVRVLIGKGAGKNFWCVLYPSLCYTDSVHAVMPEDSKETLKNLLPEDDFEALLTSRRPWNPAHEKTGQDSSLPGIKVRLKLSELFAAP